MLLKTENLQKLPFPAGDSGLQLALSYTQWRDGGGCGKETKPIQEELDDTCLSPLFFPFSGGRFIIHVVYIYTYFLIYYMPGSVGIMSSM